MALPAGPMLSLTSAIGGTCTIWKADGREQKVKVADFVIGDQRNVLAPGDLLRQIEIPLEALKRRTAFRQTSLAPVGERLCAASKPRAEFRFAAADRPARARCADRQ